jgi:predicted acetyltransferase
MVDVDVERADRNAKPVTRLLLDLCLHDLSIYNDDNEPADNGHFPYEYFDLYWIEDERVPYLIRADGKVAGIAFVRLGPPHEMAEFFILNRWRRLGVGRIAARHIFDSHAGEWHVHELSGNDSAVAFWRSVVPTGFSEHADEHGIEQRFVVSDTNKESK